jgi:beta-galactosidase
VFLFALVAAAARAQDVGRVQPASLPLPLPAASPLPPDKLRADNQWNLPMTGTWRFALTHGHIATDKTYVSEGESATNGIIFASSNETANIPEHAFDGDTTTRWCASDDSFPQWLGADLGKTEHITGVTLAWERGTAHYQFQVQGSLDKKNWTTLADLAATPGVSDGPVTITPGDFRYVRIYVTGSDTGSWASIREDQIHYTDSTGADTVWQAPPPVPPDNSVEALNKFASPKFDDSAWDKIKVPSNWEMLGYSLPTYGSVDNTVGQYRRVVTVPASWAGRKIYWRFDGALDGAEIFVNGQKAGYHESGYTEFDVDLTGLVVPGKPNLFAVRVSKTTPSDDCETGDFQCMGGIYRETSLIAVPQTHVSDITVRTPLSTDYKDATLVATVKVQAPSGKTVKIAGKLMKSDGSLGEATVFGTAVADADGEATVDLSAPVKSPVLWNAEKPKLYYLVMQLSQDGKVVESVEQRFGFKQIDIKNNVVLWNGVPIKCEGSCRHDFFADKGFALSEANWEKDITLMKAANINAIRTSHYNHAERFLELCEEKGMYILDEVPYCWIGDSVKDPTYAPYLIQRATETLARDKNKPCVIAWSIGNENPMGPNSQQVMDLVKQTDPTRPAFVSCTSPSDVKGQDWEDDHYPGPDSLDGMKKNTNMTYNLSENPHIFYQKETQDYDPGASDLWSEALSNVWQKVWAAPNILGSFIWEWQNQGIADLNDNKTNDFSYGLDRLRQENNKGIVDAYRNPKPEWWEVKQVYAQVVVGTRTVTPGNGQVSVPLTNHFSFTDLSEVTTKWTAYNGATILQSGVLHIACPPLQSVQAMFPAPAGITELRLEFDHADGTEIVADNLTVDGTPEATPPVAIAAGAALTTTDAPDTMTVANDISSVTFDKHSGEIQSWTVRGKAIVTGGPVLNLGEAKASGEKNAYEAPQPPATTNSTVTAGPANNGVISVVSKSTVLTGPAGTPLGTLKAVYDIQPDAEITVTWTMNWTAPDISLWEEGLKFSVPATSTQVSWLRDSFFTDYPVGHIGEPSGTAASTDVSFRASKRNVHWFTLTDSANNGLVVLPVAGTPLVTRANTSPTGTTLFTSTQVAGPWDFSGVWVSDHDIHAGVGKPLGGSFILRAIEQ